MKTIDESGEKEVSNCKYAPVVAFAYNRADKIIRCLESVERNAEAKETDLIIYCDGAKSEKDLARVEETRKDLCSYKDKAGFSSVKIVEVPQNKGLAKSIIEGVTEVIEQYGKVIVVEDDLVVSKKFLEYMNGALEFYEGNPNVGAISGYTYPLDGLKDYPKDVYLLHKGDCWGWATWKDAWDKASWADVNYDEYFKDGDLRRRFENTENGWDLLMVLQYQGKISSWAVRWVLSLLKRDLWTLYPKDSYVTNEGFDGSGTHSNKAEEAHYFTGLTTDDKECCFTVVKLDKALEKEAAGFPRKGFKAGVKYYLKRVYVTLFDLKRVILNG